MAGAITVLDSAAHGGGAPPSATKGLTLFEVRAGISQLRIEPENETAGEGKYVFCMGSDLLAPPIEDYGIGDMIRVDQTINIDAADELLVLQAHFRQPSGMPTRETIPSVTVDRVVSGVRDYSVLIASTDFFDSSHLGRKVEISGAPPVVAGTYEIFAVDMTNVTLTDEGTPIPTRALLVGNVLTSAHAPPESPVAATAILKGAHWQAKVLFGGREVIKYEVGQDGGNRRDIDLPDLSINVSKYSGAAELAFEFKLVETP